MPFRNQVLFILWLFQLKLKKTFFFIPCRQIAMGKVKHLMTNIPYNILWWELPRKHFNRLYVPLANNSGHFMFAIGLSEIKCLQGWRNSCVGYPNFCSLKLYILYPLWNFLIFCLILFWISLLDSDQFSYFWLAVWFLKMTLSYQIKIKLICRLTKRGDQA